MEMYERIQRVLSRKNMTQADVCRLSGLDSGKVSQVVSGRTKDPRVSTIVPIAKALGVSLDYLVFGSLASSDYEDEIQSDLNAMYGLLNDEGRSRLVKESEILVKSGMFAKSEDHKVSRTA